MKDERLRFLFITFLLFVSNSVSARYLSLNPSYDRFTNSALSENNATLGGFGLGVSLGFHTGKIPIEIFFGQNSLTGDVLHDGSEREVKVKQTNIGFRALIPVSERFYLNAGYARSETAFSLNESSTFTSEGIKSTYKLNDEELTGFIYGAGYSLNDSFRHQFYIEYNLTNYTESSASLSSLVIGYRYSFR